jgi:hypothetical protein
MEPTLRPDHDGRKPGQAAGSELSNAAAARVRVRPNNA